MNRVLIELEDIQYSYQKNEMVFDSLALKILEGQTVGIIGSNGAGKSTLLKLLVGLVEAQKGRIIIDGIESSKKTLNLIRNKVGFAFQDAESQLFMTTVYEDVAFGPRNQGFNEGQVDALVRSALNQVEAGHLVNRPPYKLSGGEKRCVALATVLAMNPEIVILDEPTTGLDPKSRRRLIDILHALEQTKIIATHDMDMAMDICDEVIVMHGGNIVEIGHPNEIFRKNDVLDRCHLEAPLRLQGCPICNR